MGLSGRETKRQLWKKGVGEEGREGGGVIAYV